MKLKSLHCPNCDADLEVEDGLDTFFCKYCGHKILLEGQSKAAYEAKVRIKKMEHEERLQDKRDEQERYKLRDLNITTFICILIVILASAVFIVIIHNVSSSSEAEEKQREQNLQTIVDQIMIDIDNKDFSNAYIFISHHILNSNWSKTLKLILFIGGEVIQLKVRISGIIFARKL